MTNAESSNTLPPFTRGVLGRTGVPVCRLGMRVSAGTSTETFEYAIERGVNYFDWGYMRDEGAFRGAFVGAMRNQAPRRDRLLIVGWTFRPEAEDAVIMSVLRNLRTDYLDVLLLSWDDAPIYVEQALRLKERGFVRRIGIIDRNIGDTRYIEHRQARIQESASLLANPVFDVFHVEYNPSVHAFLEHEFFPKVPPEKPPAIVAHWPASVGLVRDCRAVGLDEPVPAWEDFYRFVLTHPAISICLSAAVRREQLDRALAALERGPMTEEELTWMLRFPPAVAAMKLQYEEILRKLQKPPGERTEAHEGRPAEIPRSFARGVLGRSGVPVCRLGMTTSPAIRTETFEYALERGMNYFDLGYLGEQNVQRDTFAQAMRNQARLRGQILVGGWIDQPKAADALITKLLHRLRMDYLDVLFVSFADSAICCYQALRLKERGYVRHVGLTDRVSGGVGGAERRRDCIQQCANYLTGPIWDVFQMEYNPERHPLLEREFFPHIPRKEPPGILAYLPASMRYLNDCKQVATDEPIPTWEDCYRFALTPPDIGVCVSSAARPEQLDRALTALERGPMTEEEVAWMLRMAAAVAQLRQHR